MLRIAEKPVGGVRLRGAPTNKPAGCPAVLLPVDSQPITNKRIEGFRRCLFQAHLLPLKMRQKEARMLQVLSHRAGAKVLLL